MKNFWISLGVLLLAVVAIAIGKYLWFSPVLMAEGAVVGIVALIVSVVCIVHRNNQYGGDEALGCLFGGSMMFLIVLSVFSWISSDCYVSRCFGERHIYSDCETMKGGAVDTVSFWGGIFMGCFSECEVCEAKEEAERTAQRIQGKLEVIQNQIETLQEVKSKLENGEDVNIDYYEFFGDHEYDMEPAGRLSR